MTAVLTERAAMRPVVTDVAIVPGADGDQPNLRLTMRPGRRIATAPD